MGNKPENPLTWIDAVLPVVLSLAAGGLVAWILWR